MHSYFASNSSYIICFDLFIYLFCGYIYFSLKHRWSSFEKYGSLPRDKLWLKRDMQKIANKFGRSFCQPFDQSNQSQSRLCLWWCTEIKSFDSRILEFPHDADNVFTWGESHKYFTYPKDSLSTCFTHFRLSEWKGGGTQRRNYLAHLGCLFFKELNHSILTFLFSLCWNLRNMKVISSDLT